MVKGGGIGSCDLTAVAAWGEARRQEKLCRERAVEVYWPPPPQTPDRVWLLRAALQVAESFRTRLVLAQGRLMPTERVRKTLQSFGVLQMCFDVVESVLEVDFGPSPDLPAGPMQLCQGGLGSILQMFDLVCSTWTEWLRVACACVRSPQQLPCVVCLLVGGERVHHLLPTHLRVCRVQCSLLA